MASEQFKSVVSTTIHVTDALYVRDVLVTGGGGGGGVASLTSQGAGTSLVFNSTGVLKSVSAGPNVTITESTPGVLVIAATGTVLPAVGASGNVLTSDGTNWSSQPLPTSGEEGSTLPAPGSSGNVLTSDGTVWSSQPSSGDALPSAGASGNVLTSDGTNWSSQALPVTGDEGSTLPAPGSSGNVLTSDGTVWSSQPPAGDALPSAGASGNVLTSDGTNWSSQALPATGDEGSTLPAPGSTGNVLTSDGTVWSSQPPVGDALPSAGASGNVLTSDGANWSSQALPATGDEGSTLPAPGSSGNVLTSDGTTWSSQSLPKRTYFRVYAPDTGTNTDASFSAVFGWDSTYLARPDSSVISAIPGNEPPNTQWLINPIYEGVWKFEVVITMVNTSVDTPRTVSVRLQAGVIGTLGQCDALLQPNETRAMPCNFIGPFTSTDLTSSSFQVLIIGSDDIEYVDTNTMSWFYGEYLGP